jgi:hypothetical protein
MPRIPAVVKRRVRAKARDRCGYCLSPQTLVMGLLEIEHLTPQGRGGTDEESNLWLARSLCNKHKSDKISAIDPETGETVPLFNPRTQDWFEHFHWSDDGVLIIGLSAIGRATVEALHLSDNPNVLIVRSNWVLAGWHPPQE